MYNRSELTSKESYKLKVIKLCLKGQIPTLEASKRLDRSLRQTYRIKYAVRTRGVYGVIHGLKNKPSNHTKHSLINYRSDISILD